MKTNKKDVFTGSIISVTIDKIRLPNDTEFEMEVVHHPGGSAVVALDSENRICLLSQYRYVAGGWMWELPAGKIDHEEPPFLTAQRELEEEAGVIAARWEELGSVISSPGIFTERIHLYLARELEYTRPNVEDEEVFEVHWVSLKEAIDWALNGKIEDAKTIENLFRIMAE